MRLIDAKSRILSNLYAAAAVPEAWIDKDAFLYEHFTSEQHARANLVINDLSDKGLVLTKDNMISLSMSGCFEAEQIGGEMHYPQPEKTANYIALYSAIIATYITIVGLAPTIVYYIAFQYCSTNRAEWCYATVWGEYYEAYGGDPTYYWYEFGTSYLFWAILLGAVATIIATRITRRWKRPR